jgi:hypothetical protein
MSSLTSTFDEWDWLLANPRFARRGSTVAWQGFQRRILPFYVTADHLVELAEAGQYSFQVADGSIFQVTYQFDAAGEIVRYASLGFYKTVDDTVQTQLPDHNVPPHGLEFEGIQHEASQTPSSASDLPDSIPWLRLDYDPSAMSGVLHAASHLHVSLTDTVRIPVAGVPTPKQFVEAVLGWFYPDEYARAHLDDDGNFSDPGRQTTINELFCAVIAHPPTVLNGLHVMIPPASAREANE